MLSPEDELKLRRLWKPATESSLQLKELTEQYQRQIEADPYYRAVKERAQATSNAYTDAASKILKDKGCDTCRITEEVNGSMYITDEPVNAPPVVKPPEKK